MTNDSLLQEVERVDAFLAEEKFLLGPPPVWQRTPKWGGEYVAVWNIIDALEAPIAVINCFAKIRNTGVAGLNVCYRGHRVWSVHTDLPEVCHSNPHDAHVLGLDPEVCGSHEHAWPINRAHILGQDLWDLPYRRPVAVRRLSAALALLADQINLTLTPD